MLVEFAALVVVNVLESFVFVHICENFTFLVGDVLDVQFCKIVGSLVLLDVFLLH